MIRESVYMEMIRNCSKWNSRTEKERRGRYPVLDAQTGVAQRPSVGARPTLADRFPPASPLQVCTYPRRVFKRRASAPSSDATELQFFCQCNPNLNDAINAPPVVAGDVRMLAPESTYASLPLTEQMLMFGDTPKRESRPTAFVKEHSYDEEALDDLSDDPGAASDEDDWADRSRSRRAAPPKPKGRPPTKNRTSDRKSVGGGGAVAMQAQHMQPPPVEEKPFVCPHCGAKYKSRPGLNYHKAHVHAADFQEMSRENGKSGGAGVSGASEPHLAPADISSFCDFCLGDTQLNKRTNCPEPLVSCHDCGRSGHPTCLNFTANMIISTRKYGWQCIECKSCAICGTSDNDEQLLFCDDCDRGFHLYCLKPPLASPPEGEWSCHLCQLEFGQTASQPSGGVARA